MGQCVSVPHRRASLFQEDGFKHFYKSKTGNLSATFHVLDSDLKWDLLNVNNATEEQLMTLKGVNRTIARNIVEYRQAIGGFKKVEDLALVSGVGASRLEQFRSEICVNNKKRGGGSYSSSLSQSLESLSNTENSCRPMRSSPLRLVNVNTANVFQLMSIRGMTQEMAANIVHHREKKGNFKSLDDLLKVKGLTAQKLSAVRLYLTFDPLSIDNNSLLNYRISQNNSTKKSSNHRRTKSAPSHCSAGKRVADANIKGLYEYLSSQCSRPVVTSVFSYSRNGQSALRIATWNLQKLTADKAKNPGVKEVICRTILENGFSLIAVQDTTKEALSLVISELNDPQLSCVQKWEERGEWQSCISPHMNFSGSSNLQSGFIYNITHGIRLQDSIILPLTDKIYQPLFGWFRAGKLDFFVVVVNLENDSSVSSTLSQIINNLKEKVQVAENKVLLVGDFILSPNHKAFEILSSHGFHHITEGTFTNIVTQKQDCHIWGSSCVKKIITGEYGVVSEGLSHIAIPRGWELGGAASDYCPVWVEIYTQGNATESVTNGIRKVSTIPEENFIIENSRNIQAEVLKQKNGLIQQRKTDIKESNLI